MKNNKFLYVYYLGHPTSNLCAKSIGCKFIKLKGTHKNGIFQALQFPISSFMAILKFKKSNGRIYFGEGITAVYFPLFMRVFKREKNKIIVRANDDSFDIERKSFFKKKYYFFLYKQIDGLIPISELVMKDAKKYLSVPMKISHTFLWRGYSHFEKSKTSLENNVCFVGHYRPHKNIDKLAKIFSILKEKHNFAGSFFLLGSNIKQNLSKKNLLKNYFVCPGVKEPSEFFAKSRYYIHLADYEAGGTSVIEAMASGLIPIVNNKVGNNDLVKQLDEQLIIKDDNPEKMAYEINNLFNHIEKNKLAIKYSKLAKKIAKENDLKKGTENFKKAFEYVTKKINF